MIQSGVMKPAALPALMLVVCLCGCGDENVRAIDGTQVLYRTDGRDRLFDMPFPIVTRQNPDGTLDLQGFPNPGENPLVQQVIEGLESHPGGFGTNAAVYFRFDGPIGSLDEDHVFLVDLERDVRIPVWLDFKEDAETYSPSNLLAVLPRPGMVLRPNTPHAAVILDNQLGSSLVLEQLKAGKGPDELQEHFDLIWDHLKRTGVKKSRVRGATVFSTGDPFSSTLSVLADVRARAEPSATDLVQLADYERYCVVEGNVTVPLYQDGRRPYTTGGGGIRFDPDGEPIPQGQETIRFAVTIPKQSMPADGFPLLFYAPGQGGSYLQVTTRGTFEEQQTLPDRGPAYYLSASSIAAMNIEAPLTGPRHPQGSTDGIDFFNVQNPVAFRDNIRQAALDYASLVRMARTLRIPAALCPGAAAGGSEFFFDADNFLFYGHSTGASVGALVLGMEEGIRAGLLSGTGGSWLYNLTIKFEPLDFKALVELLLAYQPPDEADMFDPVINLAQTFWEPVEPMNWAGRWAREAETPKDILIIEGVVDGYFPPPMANALALAARTQPVRPLAEETIEDALDQVALDALDAPAGGNLQTPSGPVSALLLQFPQPQGISGHYVPFELNEPKHQYRCFFENLLTTGTATVPPANADPFALCGN